MSKPAKTNAAKTTSFVKKANGGSVSASKSGVNRLNLSKAYPRMPRFQDGGDVSNDEFIQQMMVGTLPVDQGPSPVDVEASKMLRALGEVARGTVGAEALEPGSEAYRTGQALANMPGVGIAVGTAKGVGKAGGKLYELEKRLLRSQGAEGAKRVQRAADEIKNLEDQFSLDALELAFQGRKGSPYQGVMTMKPGDFEKFAARLDERLPNLSRRVEDLQWVLRDAADKNLSESRRALMGFSDVPYLRADVEPGKLARITGHEGRHRTRAMTAEGMPTTLVELLPQSGLEFRGQLPVQGNSPDQWRAAVNKAFSRGVVAEKEKRLAPEVAELMFQKIQLENSSSPDWGKIRAIEEELDLWRQSGKYFLEDPTVLRQMPQVYADGGDVSTDDFIQQTFTGTPPTDQEPGIIGQGIRAAGQQLYENLREAVQDPKAFHKRALGNIATRLQEDPEGFAMDWTGGGLGGIIRPKGGGNLLSGEVERAIDPLLPKVSGRKPSEVLKEMKETYPPESLFRLSEETGRHVEDSFQSLERSVALEDWIKNKFGSYVKRQMGTEDDPIRKLADEMDAKIKDDYAAGLKRIAKMKDDIAKAKAKGKRTDVSERELADEIDRVEEAFQSASALPVQLGPYTHTSSSIGDARVKAGMSPYPVAQSRTGRAYEELADEPFVPTTKKELREDIKKSSLYDLEQSPRMELDPWLGKLKDEDLVYRIRDYDLNERHIFTHTIDELRNALNPNSGLPPQLQLKPDDMQALGIEKAFRHVNKINDWRAQQRIAANLEEAKRSAVTVKEYPDSPRKLQWQQLKPMEYTELPPGYALKQEDSWIKLYDPSGKKLISINPNPPADAPPPLKQALDFLAKNDLEKALQYEGSTMRHCVGGYCDSVWTGETKIFSLRDRKGEPHVTIETAPADIRSDGNTPLDFWRENQRLVANMPFPKDTMEQVRWNRQIIQMPEFQEWIASRPAEILQIKGKGNGKPKDDYIPFIQDFVRSQQWSRIGDIKNAELYQVTPGQRLPGFSKEMKPGYYTLDELRQIAVENDMPKDILETWMSRLQSMR